MGSRIDLGNNVVADGYRADRFANLAQQNRSHLQTLVPIRYGRMDCTLFAYLHDIIVYPKFGGDIAHSIACHTKLH